MGNAAEGFDLGAGEQVFDAGFGHREPGLFRLAVEAEPRVLFGLMVEGFAAAAGGNQGGVVGGAHGITRRGEGWGGDGGEWLSFCAWLLLCALGRELVAVDAWVGA